MKITLIYETAPMLSETCKGYIKRHLTPIFWNEDEQVHAVDYTFDILSDEIEGKGGEEVFGITMEDIKVLTELVKENVDYIILTN